MTRPALLLGFAAAAVAVPADADNLYRGSNWSAMSSDRRASQVGDVLTVVITEAAQSSNVAQNSSHKGTNLTGSFNAGHIDEQAGLSFGGGYNGTGQATRSETLVAQMTLTVAAVLPNGDLLISGQQMLNVNGDRTRIGVRGRIRSEDIRSDNSVLSNRIADAQIDYDGRGFVSRSAKPGLLNRIFSFLGLG